MGKILSVSFVSIFMIAISIMITDIKKYKIPDKLNILMLLIGICCKGTDIKDISDGIIGAGTYALPAVMIYGYVSDIIKKDAIGFGDIKLLINIGYILGYNGIKEIYMFYFITCVWASCYIGIYIISRHKIKKEIAFSPFLLITFLIFMVMYR